MVLLTFKAKHKELMDRTKVTTIRKNLDRWSKFQIRNRILELKPKIKLDMWWRNPRTRNPECYKMGIAEINNVVGLTGSFLDIYDAKRDGFNTREELIEKLGEVNDMTRSEVKHWVWAIIKFDWREGYPKFVNPVDRPFYNTIEEL